MNSPGKLLVSPGILCILTGAPFSLPKKSVPFFGSLSGDFVFSRKNTTFFAPFTSMLLVGIVVTLLANIIIRWMK